MIGTVPADTFAALLAISIFVTLILTPAVVLIAHTVRRIRRLNRAIATVTSTTAGDRRLPTFEDIA